MKFRNKRFTAKLCALAVLLGLLPVYSVLPAAAEDTAPVYSGGRIDTRVEDGSTVLTVTPDEGYELKAGSLLMTDRYGTVYIPTRVGFNTEADSSAYRAATDDDRATVAAQFIRPTREEPNMGVVKVTADTESYGLKIVNRFSRTEENGAVYTTLDGERTLVRDLGVIVASGEIVGDAEVTVETAAQDPHVRRVSAIAADTVYDACDRFVDIRISVVHINRMADGLHTPVITRAYMELADGTVVYAPQSAVTYTEALDAIRPENVVLTTGNAYPVWDAAGNKVIQAPVLDMTGAGSVLTLNNAEDITVVPGKVYAVRYSEDGTAALLPCGERVYRGRLLEKDEENGVLTIRRSGVDYRCELPENAYAATVALSGDKRYRLTVQENGVGPVSDSFNTIYGADEQGNITFILTTADGKTAYNSIYRANDIAESIAATANSPDVAAPDMESAPVAFVTAAPYVAADGQYVVDLEDLFGTQYTAVPFVYTATDYPKPDLPYQVTFNDDGTVLLEKLTTTTTQALKGVSYSDGVLTNSNGNQYYLTADTYIVYVQRVGNTLKRVEAPDLSQFTAGGIASNVYNIIQSNGMKKTVDQGFVQWMLVEITAPTPQSIYNLTDTAKGWYTVKNRLTRPGESIVLTTSEVVWDAEAQQYRIAAVDMTGAERLLDYTEGASGVIPVANKVYYISEENGVTKFAWPGNTAEGTQEAVQPINLPNENSTTIFRNLIRTVVTAYDAESRTVTLNDKNTYTLAEDVKILSVTRRDNNARFAVYRGLKDEPTVAASAYNTLFGFNHKGEIAWMLNNLYDSSIYNIADSTGYTAPALPAKE